jgi:hypothetical protein
VKNSPLKVGAKSLERGSTFKPRAGSPASKRRANVSVIERLAREAWARRARSKTCAVCGAASPRGHHIITQQQLRLTATEHGLDFARLRWDTRNLLPLCDRHHAAHHNRTHPVPRSLLVSGCPKVFQFARELGLVWWVERVYPDTSKERAA